MNDRTAGGGWLVFAGIMLMVVATLNIIWGIAAIDSSSFFLEENRYILSDLNTWGWIILIVGALQLLAAFSVWGGGAYGRWVGVIMASLSAVGALLSLPAYPVWSIAIFAVDIFIIYGLTVYGRRT